MSNPRPVGGRLVSAAILFFAPLAVLCVLLILKRLVFGIGSVTALNGGYPWGLWIAFDLLVGTGFACGGWALAWTVYIFNKGKYHALLFALHCLQVYSAIPLVVYLSPLIWDVIGIYRISTFQGSSTRTLFYLKQHFV